MSPISITGVLTKISILIAALLFSVTCGDVLVRVTGQDRPLVWRPDPRRGWRHIPGARVHWTEEGNGYVTINSLGLRDPERTIQKPAGTYRIAVFGDSMTEAVQVNQDETFTQLLERRLRARGLNVEVLNFGVNGYSPLQGYLTFDLVGKAFAPDLVLHAVFTDNDIADCDPALAAGQVGAPFVQKEATSRIDIDYSQSEASTRDYEREPLFTLRRLSATYRMLSSIRRTYAAKGAFRAALSASSGIPRRYLIYADPLEPQWEAAWDLYEKVMIAFSRDAAAVNAKFAIISVPAGQVVDPTVWNRAIKEFPTMAPKRWKLLGPEERLRGLAIKHNLKIIQPINEFQRNVDGAPLFLNATGSRSMNGMGHMTARGHEVMATALETALEADGLIPSVRSSVR